MKSYTDIEQSKKLAEFLPLESADMYYISGDECDICFGRGVYEEIADWICEGIPKPADIPCWSLAALLNLLPNEISTGERYCDKYQIDIRKYDGGDNITLYQIAYGNNRGLSGSWHDMINTSEKESAIDAYYEMILELNELNLL